MTLYVVIHLYNMYPSIILCIYLGDNYVRMWLYKKLTHHRYRIIPTIIIILSALTLIVPVKYYIVKSHDYHMTYLISGGLNC